MASQSRLWRFIFQGGKEGKFRARLFPALQDMGIGKTEGQVTGDGNFLAQRRQDGRLK